MFALDAAAGSDRARHPSVSFGEAMSAFEVTSFGAFVSSRFSRRFSSSLSSAERKKWKGPVSSHGQDESDSI